jgi:hypothetical protein
MSRKEKDLDNQGCLAVVWDRMEPPTHGFSVLYANLEDFQMISL